LNWENQEIKNPRLFKDEGLANIKIKSYISSNNIGKKSKQPQNIKQTPKATENCMIVVGIIPKQAVKAERKIHMVRNIENCFLFISLFLNDYTKGGGKCYKLSIFA